MEVMSIFEKGVKKASSSFSLNLLLQYLYNEGSWTTPEQILETVKKYADNPELIIGFSNETTNVLSTTMREMGKCILNVTQNALPSAEEMKSWNSKSFVLWKNETLESIKRNW